MMITEKAVQSRSLQKSDRCDVCSAEAFILVKLANGELTFCGHHFVENESGLRKSAYAIVDEREFIEFKPESND